MKLNLPSNSERSHVRLSSFAPKRYPSASIYGGVYSSIEIDMYMIFVLLLLVVSFSSFLGFLVMMVNLVFDETCKLQKISEFST